MESKDILFLLQVFDLCLLSQLVHFYKSHSFSGLAFLL